MNQNVLTDEAKKALENINQVYGAVEAIKQFTSAKNRIELCVGTEAIHFEDPKLGTRSEPIPRSVLQQITTEDMTWQLRSCMISHMQWTRKIGE